MNSYEMALRLAEDAHRGQYRNDGITPYIEHPKAVEGIAIELVSDYYVKDSGRDNEIRIVAILHDAIEDTYLELEDLKGKFSDKIITYIDAVTERENETYLDKIQRAKKYSVSSIVKYADLTHNLSDLDRAKNKHKYDKYLLAKYILKQGL